MFAPNNEPKYILSIDCGIKHLGYIYLSHIPCADSLLAARSVALSAVQSDVRIIDAQCINILESLGPNVTVKSVKQIHKIEQLVLALHRIKIHPATYIFVEDQPPQSRDNTDIQSAIMAYYISRRHIVASIAPSCKLQVNVTNTITYSQFVGRYKTADAAKRAFARESLSAFVATHDITALRKFNNIPRPNWNHIGDALLQYLAIAPEFEFMKVQIPMSPTSFMIPAVLNQNTNDDYI
jgi:hypothetical protein